MELEAMQYVKPELLVLIPVLLFVGMALKHSGLLDDRHIPLLLGGVGILLAVVWVLATSPMAGWQGGFEAVFTAITQGVLCAGGSVYVNQIGKQQKKGRPADRMPKGD